MKKYNILKYFALAGVLSIFLGITAMASDETFKVSPDTTLEVYSVYICYEVLTEDVVSADVVFADNVSGYGYSNFREGKIWISIAAGNPIDCTCPLAEITVSTSTEANIMPSLETLIFKINGKQMSEEFTPVTLYCLLSDGKLEVSASVKDDLMREGVAMYVAVYNSNGKMIGLKIRRLIPEKEEMTYSASFEKLEDADSVKVMFLKSDFKPCSVALFENIGSEG